MQTKVDSSENMNFCQCLLVQLLKWLQNSSLFLAGFGVRSSFFRSLRARSIKSLIMRRQIVLINTSASLGTDPFISVDNRDSFARNNLRFIGPFLVAFSDAGHFFS